MIRTFRTLKLRFSHCHFQRLISPLLESHKGRRCGSTSGLIGVVVIDRVVALRPASQLSTLRPVGAGECKGSHNDIVVTTKSLV